MVVPCVRKSTLMAEASQRGGRIHMGTRLESLRWKISPSLFAILQERAESLSAERALQALKERFDIEADEIVEEEFGSAVFGASSVNFPRRLKTRRTLPKFAPISSPGRRA